MAKTVGEFIAADLPVRDDDSESDLISLVDIVITGIEVPWVHFRVLSYDPDADGVESPWAVICSLEDGREVDLREDTVRKAVAAYVDSRIEAGLSFHEASRLVDGSYTDADIADSILQFALYGEQVYS